MAVQTKAATIQPITLPSSPVPAKGASAASGSELSSKTRDTRWQTDSPFDNIAGEAIPKVARNRSSARGLGPMFS